MQQLKKNLLNSVALKQADWQADTTWLQDFPIYTVVYLEGEYCCRTDLILRELTNQPTN